MFDVLSSIREREEVHDSILLATPMHPTSVHTLFLPIKWKEWSSFGVKRKE